MARSRKEIWMKVGEFEPKFLEYARNLEVAELLVRMYERQDKQEIAEGYGFPYGLPKYIIK